MNAQALQILTRYATEAVEKRPAAQQSEIYYALSEVLPRAQDRLAAQRVAFAIQETAKLQMDFLAALNQLPPSNTNDGDGQSTGK